jgi:LysM repeat protein
MDPRTGETPTPNQRHRGEHSGVSVRGEIALAALVVSIYLAVFGSSLLSALGWGDTPDLLHLNSQEEPVAEVAGAQSGGSAATPEPTAARAIVRVPDTPEAEATPEPRTIVRVPEPGPQQSTERDETLASVSGRHLVQAGDTLSELGELYHVNPAALKLINNLTSDTIFIGQTLAVPRPDEASQIFISRLGDGGILGD